MSDATIIHATGWSPEKAATAELLLATSQARFAQAAPAFADDTRPLPPGYSLSGLRLGKLLQYGWGTCWLHAPKRIKEVMDAAGGYEAVPVSRCMIGYQGERLMAGAGGRVGNPDSGGSVTQAFLAMTSEDEGGIGVCHEAIWPYVEASIAERSQYAGWDGDQARAAGRQYLAQGPPAGSLTDGAPSRIHHVAACLIGDGTPWQRSIFNGHPVGIGIWWTSFWDTQGRTFFDNIGGGEYGHALAVLGWCHYQGQLYWQLDNWHGELYAPLDAATAATVPGYKPTSPDKTTDFWVSDTILRRVLNFGQSEQVIAADSTGFTRKDPLAHIRKGLRF